MAIITDKAPTKAEDELLAKSAAQLQIEIDQRQWALKEKLRIEAEAKRQSQLAEASDKIDTILDYLKWLEANKFLAEGEIEHYSTKAGVFAPHLKFRKPK
jgi:hypothetical protein